MAKIARILPENLLSGPVGDHLPLYYQVAQIMRTRIMDGTWAPGKRLPTEAELAVKYEVSRPTIRHANSILAKEGYIYSLQGSGWYVNSSEKWKTQIPIIENINDVLHYGLELSFRIHEFGMVANTEEIRANLKNDDDDFVLRIEGVRWRQETPVSRVTYYLPFRFASRIPVECLNDKPFIPQFEKFAGIHVVEGMSTVGLDKADVQTAAELHVPEGESLILVKTVYFDTENLPVEFIISRYREGLPMIVRSRRV
jgi:GntR family transcriptional regulator